MKKWLLAVMICVSFASLTAGLFLLPKYIDIFQSQNQTQEPEEDVPVHGSSHLYGVVYKYVANAQTGTTEIASGGGSIKIEHTDQDARYVNGDTYTADASATVNGVKTSGGDGHWEGKRGFNVTATPSYGFYVSKIQIGSNTTWYGSSYTSAVTKTYDRSGLGWWDEPSENIYIDFGRRDVSVTFNPDGGYARINTETEYAGYGNVVKKISSSTTKTIRFGQYFYVQTNTGVSDAYSKTGYTYSYTSVGGTTTYSTVSGGGPSNYKRYYQTSYSSSLTVRVYWTINSYTLTAYANGGSISSTSGWSGTGNSATKSLNYNSTYGTLPSVSRTGYSLKGWYTASSGGTNVSTTTRIGAGNTSIYAQWTINSYTLTANANGGSISSTSGWSGTGNTATKTLNYAASYGTLPSVSRTGYTFNGWFTASSGGSAVSTSTTMGASSTTIYAQWTVNSYTVTFNGNNGQADMLHLKCGIDGSFESYSNGTSIGMNDQTGGSAFAASTDYVAAGARSLKVSYTAGSNNRFYTVGGLLNGTIYKYMAKVYIPTSSGISSIYLHTEKYGGNYTNWAGVTSSSTSTKGSWVTLSCEETSAVTSDTNLYVFIYASGSGTFYIDDWQVVTSKTNKTVTYGSTYSTLPTAARTGYTFSGWYTAASGGSKVTNSTTVSTAGNHTLYAHWTINSYTLTAYANSGLISSTSGWSGTGSSTSKTLNYAAAYSTLPTVSRSNYSLKGWYTAASGGSSVSSTSTMGAGSTSIYAQWSAIGKTITLKGRVVGKNGVVTNADNLGGSRLTGTYTSVSSGSTGSGTINQSNGSTAYTMHQGSTLTITPAVASGYKYLGYSTSASTKPSVSSFPTSSSITVPTLDTTYYLYFQEVAAPLYYTTERGGYWYYEDGKYPQTYVGTSLSGASATVHKFKVNGTDYTVYSANGSEYIQIAAPMTGVIKLNNGTTVSFTQGTKYWFRIDPIRWRVSNYGASASKYSLSSVTTDLVGVSDILGHGRVNEEDTVRSSTSLTYWRQDCPAVGYTNASDTIEYFGDYYQEGKTPKIETNDSSTSSEEYQENKLIVADLKAIQLAAHNGTAQENLQTYASDLSAMLQCRDYNNSTGWTSSIYNIGSGIVVGPGSGTRGAYWSDETNTFGFVYAHQVKNATCLGTKV